MNKNEISKSTTDEPHNYLSALKDMEHKMEDMFQRLWHKPSNHDKGAGFFSGGAFGHMPKMDVIDKDNEIIVKAELAGFDKDDLDISISNRQLVIKAKTCKETNEEDSNYLKHEISKKEIYRSVFLPAEVEEGKIESSFKNGVLELQIPKQEGSQRRRIEVK